MFENVKYINNLESYIKKKTYKFMQMQITVYFFLWLYNGCNPCTDTFPYDEHKFVIISLSVIKLNIVCIDLSCQFRWINIVLVKNVEVHI